MKNVIEYFHFYANGIHIIIALSATLLGLKYIKEIGFYSIFILITASSFIQNLTASFIRYFNDNDDSFLKVKISIHLYILIEFILISYFFFYKIQNLGLKKIILVSFGLFSTVLLFFIITNNYFIIENYSILASIEAILILIACIFMFIQILNDDSNQSLIYSPDFIITSGLFFFFSFTCPFYILSNYLRKEVLLYNELSILNDLAYIIFYISLIISFVCKIRISRS